MFAYALGRGPIEARTLEVTVYPIIIAMTAAVILVVIGVVWRERRRLQKEAERIEQIQKAALSGLGTTERYARRPVVPTSRPRRPITDEDITTVDTTVPTTPIAPYYFGDSDSRPEHRDTGADTGAHHGHHDTGTSYGHDTSTSSSSYDGGGSYDGGSSGSDGGSSGSDGGF